MAGQIDTAPRRTGRPRKADDMRRANFTVRLTSEEQAALAARSTAAGLTASAFIRAAVQGASVAPRRAGSAAPELVGQLRRIGNNLNQTLVEARIGNFPPAVATAAEDALRDVSAALRRLLHGPER